MDRGWAAHELNGANKRDEELWGRFAGGARLEIDGRGVGSLDRKVLGSLDRKDLGPLVGGKRILITGAGGSIGSALTRALATMGAGEMDLLDTSETGLHELGCDPVCVARDAPTRLVVGNIGDEALVREVFERSRPQIVFHAAACKHVPLMEANPFTAAETNALGSKRILRTAVDAGVEQVVLLSTDKAVEPSSVMGATKRVAEFVALTEQGLTRLKAVRLGNVFGSSGSVVPMFQEQIRRGGAVTVTHAEATRYFLPMTKAVRCLVAALADEVPAGVLIPEMGDPHRILDLARFLMAEAGSVGEIKITGLRPGDKLSERLTGAGEVVSAEAVNGLHAVTGVAVSRALVDQSLKELGEAMAGRDLSMLLGALQLLVPEYRPSDVLERERMLRAEGVSA